jgi:hypothetical protein
MKYKITGNGRAVFTITQDSVQESDCAFCKRVCRRVGKSNYYYLKIYASAVEYMFCAYDLIVTGSKSGTLLTEPHANHQAD